MLHSKVRNTFLKDRTEESRQRHNKEKKIMRNTFERTSDYFNNFDEKKVCIKMEIKMESGKPSVLQRSFQMKKMTVVDDKVIWNDKQLQKFLIIFL